VNLRCTSIALTGLGVPLPTISLASLVLMGLDVASPPGIFQRVTIFSQIAAVMSLVGRGRLLGDGL
jgi:hypothetical protein